MKPFSPLGTLLVTILLLLTAISFPDSPPANTIPIIGLKAKYGDIDTEFFCFLSWNNFDGLSREFFDADSILNKVVLPGDTTGMLTIVNPSNLTSVTNWYSHMFDMDSDSAYARPGWNGVEYQVGGSTYTCTGDTLIYIRTYTSMQDEMIRVAQDIDTLFNQNSNSV